MLSISFRTNTYIIHELFQQDKVILYLSVSLQRFSLTLSLLFLLVEKLWELVFSLGSYFRCPYHDSIRKLAHSRSTRSFLCEEIQDQNRSNWQLASSLNNLPTLKYSAPCNSPATLCFENLINYLFIL